MSCREFLKQEQSVVDDYLKTHHGYELLWMGDDLLYGPTLSPIKRRIKVCFPESQSVEGFFPQVCVNKEALPFQENLIDCVVLSHLIEKEKKPENFLREINRVLRQDGKLLILGKNRSNFWRFFLIFGVFQRLPWSITSFLKRAGWGLEKRTFLKRGRYVLLFQRKMLTAKPLKSKEGFVSEESPVLDLLNPKPKPCPQGIWQKKRSF